MAKGSWTIKIRPIRILNDCIEITLSDASLAYVDLEDRELVEGYNWTAEPQGYTIYAKRRIAGRTTYLHRMIMEEPEGALVDHRDRDGLNCRRYNLRVATHQQNTSNMCRPRHNTSGIKGVSRHKDRWRAFIQVKGKSIALGGFATKELAAAAYAEAARKYHGDFASPDQVAA